MNNLIKLFVERSVTDALLKKQEEFKYANVWLECDGYPEPYFWIAPETKTDPIIKQGDVKGYYLKDYMDRYYDKWLVMMIKDIAEDIEAAMKPDETTKLEQMIDDMRHKSFDIGKPKYKKED